MNVIVLGSGGREHALALKLSEEATVFALPGNPGIAEVATLLPGSLDDFEGIAAACRDCAADLVVVGPEAPLIAGLADFLRAQGFAVFGPDKAAARLEGSKAFSKQMMAATGVPTAPFKVFDDAASACAYARERFAAGDPVVVKADGAALGKGVVVADTAEEACEAINAMMVDKCFGEAGTTVVLESRLTGREFSLLTLCSDTEIYSLPVAQDYKRIGDGDTGPNTGGMGTYSPTEWVSDAVIKETEDRVVRPLLADLMRQGISYRGVLFSGLMLGPEGIMCLEYNVRFGDPETQSALARLGSGLLAALLACAKGEPIPAVEVAAPAAVTVVIASGGYPGDYAKGLPISVGELPTGCKLLHAGTALKEGQLVTNGGRVLCLTATGDNVDEARALAYQGVKQVRFEGIQCRTDIAGDLPGKVPLASRQ